MSAPTYDDFMNRLKMPDLLVDAGYTLNRRDGLRYPSYVRHDNTGRRISGDKFIVTQNGQYCFQPPVQKSYNVISFIKEHPDLFAEYKPGMNLDRLVNLVCCRLLNTPVEERVSSFHPTQAQPAKAFQLDDYLLTHFTDDRAEQRKFYPFFAHRGINWSTQNAFRDHFVKATRQTENNPNGYANLSFPLTIPGQKEWVGFEERGMRRADGKAYKGKASGSNSSEGLWIASPAGTPLSEAKDIYWFESGYDAMAYYQLCHRDNPTLWKGVFVSTGGNPTVGQMRGMVSHTPSATHHLCFDNDLAGRQFTENLESEIHRAVHVSIKVTTERKPYLDSLPSHQDFDFGDIELLPAPLQDSYAKYESAWEETMSMRQSRLCYEGDIREQEKIMGKFYQTFRNELRDFLGISKERDTIFVREEPKGGHKDWNEQLLAEIEMEKSKNLAHNEAVSQESNNTEDTEQNQRTRFHR